MPSLLQLRQLRLECQHEEAVFLIQIALRPHVTKNVLQSEHHTLISFLCRLAVGHTAVKNKKGERTATLSPKLAQIDYLLSAAWHPVCPRYWTNPSLAEARPRQNAIRFPHPSGTRTRHGLSPGSDTWSRSRPNVRGCACNQESTWQNCQMNGTKPASAFH